MKLISKWLLLKPVLEDLIRQADEELAHQWSYVVIGLGGFIVCLLFLTVGG